MRTAPGSKENAMTVTLSKRLFEDSAIGSGCLSSPPASKKQRALTPLADHLTSCQGRSAAAGLPSLQQHHHSSASRKRRHDTGPDSNSGAASPSTGLKRGKRADGRSSTAAASPNTAKSALEALLTYEGLEKDPDLAAEVAYITARQSAPGTAGDSNAAAGPSSAGGPSSSSAQQERSAATPAAAGSSAARVQDAARSSREKRRDQDQNPRARRASGGGGRGAGTSSSRDQVPSLPTSPDAPQPATAAAAAGGDNSSAAGAAAGDQPGSPRPVTLDLTADKEWQRLFAVLTISDAASGRRGSSSGNTSSGATAAAAAAADGRLGAASHRLTDALDGAPSTPSAAAAAGAGSLMQEAPSTPARLEGCSTASHAADVTPRRSSFLAGEFNRVQQLRNTPPRADPEARSVRLHTFCPPPAQSGAVPDCDMAL